MLFFGQTKLYRECDTGFTSGLSLNHDDRHAFVVVGKKNIKREREDPLALKKLLFQIHSIYLVVESLLFSFGFGSLTKYSNTQ